MEKLKDSKYRNAILEVVEAILKDCKYKVEIDTNNDGELIEYTKNGMKITFCYYEIEAGVLDFSRFIIEFKVFNSLVVNQFSSLNSVVVKYIRDEFLKLYPKKLETIKESEKKKEFKFFLNTLTNLVKSPLNFDYNDNYYELASMLIDKGFSEFPTSQNDFPEYMEQFKKEHTEIYLDIVSELLQAKEWIDKNMFALSIQQEV